jgi:hypothetical protein
LNDLFRLARGTATSGGAGGGGRRGAFNATLDAPFFGRQEAKGVFAMLATPADLCNVLSCKLARPDFAQQKWGS